MLVRLSDGRELPIEMYKVRVVQKTTLPPAAERYRAIEEAGLQHVPALDEGHLRRHAHRQRHERDERQPVRGHDGLG